MRVSLISLYQNWEEKESNKILCESFVKKSTTHSVDLVIFPEMSLTGFSMNTSEISEKFENSDTITFFKYLAKKNNIAIVFGVAIKERVKSSNRLVLVTKDGEILVNYSKIHPFSYSKEDSYYVKGKALGYCIFNKYSLGFAICYDLRFPELYQSLSKTSEAIITIANWPQKRVDHWQTLLKARAIENQVVNIGVNRIGTDGNGIIYEKSSFVYGPDGALIIPEYSEEEIDIYKLDISLVKEIRKSFPVKNDRQVELYKEIL